MNGWGVTFHHRRWTMMDCHIESCRVQPRQVDGSQYSFTSVFSEAFLLGAPVTLSQDFMCFWILLHLIVTCCRYSKSRFFARPQAELCLYCCCVNNGTNRFSLKRAFDWWSYCLFGQIWPSDENLAVGWICKPLTAVIWPPFWPESIGKSRPMRPTIRSINRAAQGLFKTPLIVLIEHLGEK